MTSGQQAIDAAITSLESLRKVLGKQQSNQVKSEDEKQLIKATALAWFNNHRAIIEPFTGADALSELDKEYRHFLTATTKGTLRSRYVDALQRTKKHLNNLQTDHVLTLATTPAPPAAAPSTDQPPLFSTIISDAKMQGILRQRWQEIVVCVTTGAPLAATVMMGGLLEGLLLAKINQLPSQAPVHTAATAPRDRTTGKTLPLKEWGLKNYIDVAHELTWITTTAKDIGEVLRDYRNYIHPQKEYSHGITLQPGDADMLWNIAKSMINQLLKT